MRIFRERIILHAYLGRLRQESKIIGFVPTMGALHEGHISLIDEAASRCDIVVCSIFINPTQFTDPKDYEKYPLRTEEDIRKLLESRTDVLFLPSVFEVYGKEQPGKATYALSRLETRWEGAFRPGHFQGVAQVMEQLLHLVQPNMLFMGEKDYQQVLIVQELTALLGLPVSVISCPTRREADGLAMSSRNVRLSAAARSKASLIHNTLIFIRDNFRTVPFSELLATGTARLADAGFKVEYLAITDGKDLRPLPAPVHAPMVCLAAAWLDGVRLIDNIPLTPSPVPVSSR